MKGKRLPGKHVQGREVGSIYITENEGQQSPGLTLSQGGWPGRFAVFRQGDGTLEGDTVCLGLFWEREKAGLFKIALDFLEDKE